MLGLAFIFMMLIGDTEVAERLALLGGSAFAGLILIVFIVFLLINGLITLPYFSVLALVGGLNVLIRRRKINLEFVKKWCIGIFLSVACLVLAILVSTITGVIYAT